MVNINAVAKGMNTIAWLAITKLLTVLKKKTLKKGKKFNIFAQQYRGKRHKHDCLACCNKTVYGT